MECCCNSRVGFLSHLTQVYFHVFISISPVQVLSRETSGLNAVPPDGLKAAAVLLRSLGQAFLAWPLVNLTSSLHSRS